MTTAPTIDIQLSKGKTFEMAFLYGDDQLEYRTITAIPGLTPVVLTVPNHDLPDGWPVRVQGVRAPAGLNTIDDEVRFVRVRDADTIEFNELIGLGWKDFAGVGAIAYNRPADIAGFQARAVLRDKVGGTVLLRWSSDPQAGADGLIEVDVTRSQFVLRLDAAETARIAFARGVWEMEVESPGGHVYPLVAISRVSVVDELVTE